MVSNSRGFHFCYFWSRTQDVVLSSFLVLQSRQLFLFSNSRRYLVFLVLNSRQLFASFFLFLAFFFFFFGLELETFILLLKSGQLFPLSFLFFVSNSRRFFFFGLDFLTSLNQLTLFSSTLFLQSFFNQKFFCSRRSLINLSN